ncbi:MAG TPA: EamA family transporter RarD [Actinomycetes bacterium]|nr:EamA family transporter RarD [Actinomycetes bacterium]
MDRVLTDDHQVEARRGLSYGVACYLIWGLFPLYWPLLEPAGAVEIMAHRVVWSLVFVLAVLAVRRRWEWLRPLLADRALLARLALAAVLIAGNWALYIWGVNNEHVVETSLGYFINPVVTVLIGVIVLHERLRRLQWVAVAIGASAVVVLTVDYGRPPWIALGLAGSFATYGLLKKQVGPRVGALQSLTVETAVIALPALGFLVALEVRGDGQLGHSGVGHGLLLASAGVVTAIPLLFFAAAARRVPLSILGLLQYLTPVLQFLTGVLLYDEPMPASRLVGFALIWAALALLTFDSLRTRRSARRAPDPGPESVEILA